MPCFHPLPAYEGPRQENGKLTIAWNLRDSAEGIALDLPCGKCLGCRLNRSRNWAFRCMHEASMYRDNSFVTLTYDDDHLPLNGSLDVTHWQDFMKRLRKRVGHRIRYFHAGEYGGKLGRPHYHALLFGLGFPDKVFHTIRNGNKVYKSEFLKSVWTHGNVLIGSVTFESAAYVARYCLKKVVGEEADDHYGVKVPEYVTMSRGGRCKSGSNLGGIGKRWFEKYSTDCYPSDFLVVNGAKLKPPRFYDNLLDKIDPDLLELIKVNRRKNVGSWQDNDYSRLAIKEQVLLAKISQYSRPLED